ncbi:unnamed protein product [Fusarium graminearum]|uniref:Uncharacterized protein n=1 Tax=Gibberella zeae TaxID=5518 RepID=A0A4E9EKH2_GIBZA|nr:unnamed protein product [Fusarium graminearum]CAF3581470.1 unnamed protein product [Fusarium graminearum]CAG1988607.1 unnamed protein product [Fusarium graminearum]CAG1994163.1 unnamed protein product [Fusarium graminearum]
MVIVVVRFLLSSYLGDQRESENVVDCLVEIAGVANLVVDAGGDVCEDEDEDEEQDKRVEMGVRTGDREGYKGRKEGVGADAVAAAAPAGRSVESSLWPPPSP